MPRQTQVGVFEMVWRHLRSGDALLLVPNMEMTRHLKNGDARKRIPPSEGWPRAIKVGRFTNFHSATPNESAAPCARMVRRCRCYSLNSQQTTLNSFNCAARLV